MTIVILYWVFSAINGACCGYLLGFKGILVSVLFSVAIGIGLVAMKLI